MIGIPKPEFPRPDRVRKNWLNLNGRWDFALNPEGEARYDREIVVPFSWVCPLSGVEIDEPGVGWYRREVSFEAAGRIFLCFGAVDYLADVYVNGTHVGRHQGGYTQFEIDVTPVWKPGVNRIEVRAEDYRREDQTYGKQGYGEIQGIWQTVWLEARPEAYIDSFRIETLCTGAVSIDLSAVAPDGAEVNAEFDGRRFSARVMDGKARIECSFGDPKLWSPDEPNLYEGTISLGADAVGTYFGIREISSAPGKQNRWITLNGKPIYLNGTLDQAFNPKGHFTYPTDESMRDEAWRLKRLGLNMVRIHIKPEEPRKLYWMDKLGVLVMADIPCFWGEPNEKARAAYENEWPDIIARDYNHPSIFAWVMFNETWGLHTKVDGKRQYLPETQEWVRSVYKRAKLLDKTRFVEDNSPCLYDHVETDINTWHFYLNGYETVRDHLRKMADETRPGSAFNFTGDNRQTDAPLMNSECGMVWGVDESAGDSDIAWQYHYMLNEFRLHDVICGFVFTEFHDVVNEFNGYYRIDDKDKDFGYQDYCRGMSIKDLHAPDFIAVDCAPCTTIDAGKEFEVPLVLSSFTDAYHGKKLSLEWELWHDGLYGCISDARGEVSVSASGYGAAKQEPLRVRMPDVNAVAVLSLYLKNPKGAIIARNFVTFDVRAPIAKGMIVADVNSAVSTGFTHTWSAQENRKACFGGAGEATYKFRFDPCDSIGDIDLFFEAGAKRVLPKDLGDIGEKERDLGFMRGYRVDRGAYKNSYFMTDEDAFPSNVEVLVNGELVASIRLENDCADARGVLSWHHQKTNRWLDEAGSYGELKLIRIPSRLVPSIARAGHMSVTFRTDAGGLALYGRDSGRYGVGLGIVLSSL